VIRNHSETLGALTSSFSNPLRSALVAKPLVFALLCFWLYLAYTAFSAGNPTQAVIYLVIGGALTAWRLGIFGGKKAAS
jgi:hypothetical protein